MEKILIVAEIGSNHNGNIDLAYKLVDEAFYCGVDAVKFQTFKASDMITKGAEMAEYQKKNTGEDETQLELVEKLELSFNDYLMLKFYAESKGLIVFSTPYDAESVEFLQKIGQNIWKIPSGELTDLPYLEAIRDIKCENKKILMSTGMATMEEIKAAYDIISEDKSAEITILHCNTAYPTKDYDVNVSAILELKKEFPNAKIGFSDHSIGSVAATMATSFGVSLIEKHFTLDKKMKGPEHIASATPIEFKELVTNIRRAEVIYGIEKKVVTDSEKKNISTQRKCIVALTEIKVGDIYSTKNLTCKRGGVGISPMRWYDLIGKPAQKNFNVDDIIEHNFIMD
ncbi:MAG: N-acetylneuraminate synthase family protein [Acholeplasmatales bacterium]|nr:N-acetylneuraminate synthase family protein [Acholeplasmatales bacterium]